MRWYSARAYRWCWQFLLLQCKLWACRTKTQMEFFMCVINTYTKYVIVWLINCHRKYPMNFPVPNNHWKFSIWLNPGKKLFFPVQQKSSRIRRIIKAISYFCVYVLTFWKMLIACYTINSAKYFCFVSIWVFMDIEQPMNVGIPPETHFLSIFFTLSK